MTDWRTVAALGLGCMKVTDLVREVFERATGMTPRPYLKSTLATALAVGAGYAYADGWKDRLATAGGIAGMAAIAHEGYAVLSTRADQNKVSVLQLAARSAVSAQTASAPGRRVPPL